MAQADGVIQNDTGANVRVDLNNNIAAAFTNHSGASAPSTTYAYQFFADTANDELKIRNGANSAWFTIGDLTKENLGLTPLSGGTFTGPMEFTSGSAVAPSISFSVDNDTGIYRSGSNQLAIAAGGTQTFRFFSTFNQSYLPLRLPDGTASLPCLTNTGDTNCGLFFPSADKVGVSAAGVHQYSFDATSIDVLLQNEVRFYDADSSNYAAVKAPGSLSANYTLTLPGNDGDADQFLKTDGNGALSWSSVSTPAAVPTGSVFCMATATVPSGYLECNGAAVSRSTYSTLFAVTGTLYGSGNGSTTFNLPDLRGEFVRGWDNGKGTDSGRSIGTSQVDATDINGLTLDFTDPGHRHSTESGVDDEGDLPYRVQTERAADTLQIRGQTTSVTTGISASLSSTDEETRPRNIAMMYVIKT